MSAKNGSLRLVLKLGLVVALLAGIALAVQRGLRTDAYVATVKRGLAVDAVTGSIEVHADGDFKDVKSELPGRVVWCDPLNTGNHFKTGDVLLRLDDTEIQRAIETARRTHDQAQEKSKLAKERDPERKLAEEAVEEAKRRFKLQEASEEMVKDVQRKLDATITRLDLADIDARFSEQAYQSQMKELQEQLDKTTIKAPFDGAVNEVFAWPGALIGAGAPLFTIYSDTRLVVAKISEESFAKVKLGQPAEISLVIYPGKTFPAKVTRILPTADASQRYTIHLEAKNADPDELKPGATGEVRIEVGRRDNQSLVRRTALFNGNNVCVVKDGRVEKRTVELGFTALNVVEVTKGVEAGELVIVDAPDEFRAGQRVNAKSAE